MKAPLPFKVGLVIYGSYPDVLGDPELLLQRLQEVALDEEFDVVELPLIEDETLWPTIREISKESRIELVAAAGPSCITNDWNLSSPDSSERQKAVAGLRRATDYAYAIGAKQLIFISGRDPGEAERNEAHAALSKSLSTLARYTRQTASEYLLTLSLEPADRDMSHRQYIGPTTEALELLVRTREHHKNVNVTLDMSHIPQLKETLLQATSTLGGLVAHAHIANALVRDPSRPEYGDQHPRFGLPGSEFDEADIANYLNLLFEHCFQYVSSFPYGKPVVSLEVKPTGNSNPQLGLAGAKRAFFAACSRLRADSLRERLPS